MADQRRYSPFRRRNSSWMIVASEP